MWHAKQQDLLRPPQNAVYASLFGDFQLTAADGSEILISNRRARALLAMLCLVRDESIDRDYLSKLLWPGRFEAHAKASLRQCLLDLGKLLSPHGSDILVVTRSRVGLNASAVQTDFEALENALMQGEYTVAAEQLASIGTKPLLDQMDFGDAFNSWLATHSLDAERRLHVAVMDGVAALEKDGDIAGHQKLLGAWTARDSSAKRSLVTDSISGKTRIAVLPFHSLDAQDGHDYFADGMVDELITTLGQVSQLMVAGRTSSFHFRDSDLPPASIAEALRVSHLVEGSVQRQGDRVRIHVHLIAGETGFELWSTRFDGTLGDVFALQENVGQAITAAIGSTLGIAMQPPKIQGMTQNKQAYDLFLQGRALCARRFGDGVLDTAVTLFEQALALDPDFAECWVALAEAHQLVAVYTQCLDRNAAAARMATCAQRAIALSPQLGYPYALLGVYELTRNNFAGALDYGYQAYRLDPNDPAVAMRLAYFLIFIGRTRDAAPYIKAAVDQDPVDGRKYSLLWGVQFCMGDLAAASESAQRMVDLGMMSIPLGVTSAALGKHDLAIEQYLLTQQAVNDIILPPVGIGIQTPEAMDAYWLMAAKAICGGKEEDRQIYHQVLEMLYAVLHDKSDLAISGPAVFTGNAELVFKTIGHSISPSNLMALVPFWADIEPIRQIWQHPEFIPFAQRIGMAAAWDKYGWPDLLPPPSNL
jgi:TolB-like protein/DNA-binding winged helix-turn-helix (wHTH) protein/Tfp pilus assembly protein PilF